MPITIRTRTTVSSDIGIPSLVDFPRTASEDRGQDLDLFLEWLFGFDLFELMAIGCRKEIERADRLRSERAKRIRIINGRGDRRRIEQLAPFAVQVPLEQR